MKLLLNGAALAMFLILTSGCVDIIGEKKHKYTCEGYREFEDRYKKIEEAIHDYDKAKSTGLYYEQLSYAENLPVDNTQLSCPPNTVIHFTQSSKDSTINYIKNVTKPKIDTLR